MQTTMFADTEQLARGFARLKPGHALLYAEGVHLEGGKHPTARMVRAWIEEGCARGEQHRSGTGWRYTVRKLPPAPQTACPDGAQSGVAQAGQAWPALSPGMAAMLDLLADCASAGACCPSNEHLAEELLLPDRHRARRLFDKLVMAGAVRVIEPNRFGARVIEIVATGARTAPARQEKAR